MRILFHVFGASMCTQTVRVPNTVGNVSFPSVVLCGTCTTSDPSSCAYQIPGLPYGSIGPLQMITYRFSGENAQRAVLTEDLKHILSYCW